MLGTQRTRVRKRSNLDEAKTNQKQLMGIAPCSSVAVPEYRNLTPRTFQSWSASRCCTIGSSSGRMCSSLKLLESMSSAAAEHLRRFHTRNSSSSSSPSSSSASPAAASRARACLLCVGLMSCSHDTQRCRSHIDGLFRHHASRAASQLCSI